MCDTTDQSRPKRLLGCFNRKTLASFYRTLGVPVATQLSAWAEITPSEPDPAHTGAGK